MPKLYYTKSSCAVACFIAAFTAELSIETEQFDLKNHKTSSGADFFGINPKGNSPTLILDGGTVLNESAAVLQYIADLVCEFILFLVNPILISHILFRLLERSLL
jgi:glutathione S-transferase